MVYDRTEGANSPVFVGGGHRGDSGMMMIAVMVILIVFIFVIFAIFAMRGHDNRNGLSGGGLGELAVAAALPAVTNKGGYCQMTYDNARDNLKEFGQLKYEIAERHNDTQRVIYEQNEKTRAEIAAIAMGNLRDENLKQFIAHNHTHALVQINNSNQQNSGWGIGAPYAPAYQGNWA